MPGPGGRTVLDVDLFHCTDEAYDGAATMTTATCSSRASARSASSYRGSSRANRARVPDAAAAAGELAGLRYVDACARSRPAPLRLRLWFHRRCRQAHLMNRRGRAMQSVAWRLRW